jgi:hypothetical protein
MMANSQASLIQRLAAWVRNGFNAWSPLMVVLVTGAVAGTLMWVVHEVVRRACGPLTPNVFDLELSFSGPTFQSLAQSNEACRVGIANGFKVDWLFTAAYPFFLSGVYLWAERWRRAVPSGWNRTKVKRVVSDTTVEPTRDQQWFVALPFLAALLDALPENVLLLIATVQDGSHPLLVGVASWAAALKWAFLVIFALRVVYEICIGSRGYVLWQSRYSLLAFAISSVPLLVTGQGQDILQRLAEGDLVTAGVRTLVAVFALFNAAWITWYGARALTRVLIPVPQGLDSWLEFFVNNIPRMSGVAVLATAGAAFARAAGNLWWFVPIALLSYVIGVIVHRVWRPALVEIGAGVLRRINADAKWTEAPLDAIATRFGRAVIATVVGLWILSPIDARVFGGAPTAFETDRLVLLFGSWLLLIATWVLYLIVYFRHDFPARTKAARPVPADGAEAKPPLRAFVVVKETLVTGLPHDVAAYVTWSTLGIAVFVAFMVVSPVKVARLIGPVTILAIAATSLVCVGSIAAYHTSRRKIPFVALGLGYVIAVSMWNDNHPVRTLGDSSASAVASAVPFDSALSRWYTARQADSSAAMGKRVPMFLVAASGGGLRAAYWTSLVLAVLQDADSSFARHLFAISGVSGGSVGASVFTALVQDAARDSLALRGCPRPPDDSIPALTPCVRAIMSEDFLSPVLASLMGPDAVQRIIPAPIGLLDRSRGFEASWEQTYARATTHNSLREGYLQSSATSGSRRTTPYLLLNTTLVETGQRYVTSPFADSAMFPDGWSVTHALGADLPLITAAHNSARFPIISPPGRLVRRTGASWGSVVDGGYFENSGLVTLEDVRRRIEASAAIPVRSLPEIFVVYLCNDPMACARTSANERLSREERGGAGELLGPLNAIVNAQDARGELARAQVETVLGAHFLTIRVCDPAGNDKPDGLADPRLVAARERVANPPLGWVLSQAARDIIDWSLSSALTTRAGAASGGSGSTWDLPVRGDGCRTANLRALGRIRGVLKAARK